MNLYTSITNAKWSLTAPRNQPWVTGIVKSFIEEIFYHDP